jgi:hypothetical protein
LILRIGLVVIGVYVMQIMLHLVRYNTRMYFHWSMCSALVKLSGANHLIIKEVAATLMPSAIDFGKPPTSPSETMINGILGSVKQLAKKIPNRA